MGRYCTGAISNEQCLQINIKEFKDDIKSKRRVEGSLNWSTGASISFLLYHGESYSILTLSYNCKDRNGEKKEVKYNVNIISIPSNLGKGRIYSFFCPFGLHRCKILYLGYGSHYFKSRKSYNNRIYYASQLSSQLNLYGDRYLRLECQLNRLVAKSHKTHYRGNKTPIQLKIEKIKEKRDYYNRLRHTVYPKSLIRFIYASHYDNAKS